MHKIAIPVALGAASLLMLGVTAGQASAATSTVYVSPSGTSSGADTSCSTAAYSDINAAIAASTSGGTVVVCQGTYDTQVVIEEPLTLTGESGAVINAKGQTPLTIGTTTLPGSIGIGVLLTSKVKVSGFKVVDAGFDAILVGLSSHVTVSHNVLQHNGDVGVDLNGASYSVVKHNTSKYNAGGGYLVADDVGATSHNTVSWNTASHNPGGCGVIVAGHSTAGVTHNLIAHNVLTYNGTLKSVGGGAGVIIASEVPGETVADNTVEDNTIYGNGLAGVAVHAHLRGQNLNGNRIIDNRIGVNNTIGDGIDLFKSKTSTKKNVAVADKKTTGILVGAASAIHILISGNHLVNDHYGIFLEGIGKVVHATLHANHFRHVAVKVEHVKVS